MQKISSKSPNIVQANGHGALRKVLDAACTKTKCDLADLTVLSAKSDPYRLDTAAGHRDAAWLAKEINRLLGATAKIHWRGLHYVFATNEVRKPDGAIYLNTDDDWLFLSEVAGKRARWLGYIDFERILDNRNAEPIIHRKASPTPKSYVAVGLEVDIPAVDDLEPQAYVSGFEGRQPFQFVIFGEKASLEAVALPVARLYQADIYLDTGEISDARMYRIAKDAVADGRPLVVFTLTDCDPAGYQMSVSIGRKLQALRDLLFKKLKFELVPVALTVEQVRELGFRRRRSRRPKSGRIAGGKLSESSRPKSTPSPRCGRTICATFWNALSIRTSTAALMPAFVRRRTLGWNKRKLRSTSRLTSSTSKRFAKRPPIVSPRCRRRSTTSIRKCGWPVPTTSTCRRSKSPSRTSKTATEGKPSSALTTIGSRRRAL